MFNVRDIAGKARRAISEPTYESVSRELGYEIVWSEQQSLINHAKQSRYAWLTKTLQIQVDGSVDGVPLPDDFGGIYNATYDPAFYTNRALPDIQIVSATGLDEIDFEAEATPTRGALGGLAVVFNGEQNLLVARPRTRIANLLISYVPGLWAEGTPSDRVAVIAAFQTTLLTTAVALAMLQSAQWDGLDEAGSIARAQRYLDASNPRSLASAYAQQFRQFDRYIFNPNAVGTTYAPGFGWSRR